MYKFFIIFAFAVVLFALGIPKHGAQAENAYDAYYKNINRSCQVDADCVVKNIGNCCGAYTECVNVKASVHPWLVEHYYCRKSRMAAICDSRPPQSCRCSENQCTDLEQTEKRTDE